MTLFRAAQDGDEPAIGGGRHSMLVVPCPTSWWKDDCTGYPSHLYKANLGEIQLLERFPDARYFNIVCEVSVPHVAGLNRVVQVPFTSYGTIAAVLSLVQAMTITSACTTFCAIWRISKFAIH